MFVPRPGADSVVLAVAQQRSASSTLFTPRGWRPQALGQPSLSRVVAGRCKGRGKKPAWDRSQWEDSPPTTTPGPWCSWSRTQGWESSNPERFLRLGQPGPGPSPWGQEAEASVLRGWVVAEQLRERIQAPPPPTQRYLQQESIRCN